MRINRDNYEAYLLDLAEGRLSPELERELMDFLGKNPDANSDIDIQAMSLPLSDENFPWKDDLKKGGSDSKITLHNYRQFCIAQMEGDLSAFAEERLQDFLSRNPAVAHDASIYSKLILKPDKTVVFPQKNLLRKVTPAVKRIALLSRRQIYQAVSVAATLAILVSAWFFVQQSSGPGQAVTLPPARETIPAEVTTPSELATSTEVTTPAEVTIPSGMVTQVPDPAVTATAQDRDETVNEITSEALMAYSRGVETISPEQVVENAGGRPGVTPSTGVTPAAGVTPETGITSEALATEPLPPARMLSGKEINVQPPARQVPGGDIQMTALYTGQPQAADREPKGPAALLSGVVTIISRGLDEETERERISLWDLADAGFRGLNTIAGTNLRLERGYNQDGQLLSFGFASRIIEIQHISPEIED